MGCAGREGRTFRFSVRRGGKAALGINVFLAAIHNDAINRNTKIVKDAALESSFFEIELFSSIRSSLDQSLAPQMIFEMGAGSTKLYIVERGC